MSAASILDLSLNVTTLVIGIISFLVSLVFILVVGIELLLSSNLLDKGAHKINEGLMLTMCKAVTDNGNQFLIKAFDGVHGQICPAVKWVHCINGGQDPGPGNPPTSRIASNCASVYPGVTEYATFQPAPDASTLTPYPTPQFPSGPPTIALGIVADINNPGDDPQAHST